MVLMTYYTMVILNLRRAREMGDYLIVALSQMNSIKLRIKVIL